MKAMRASTNISALVSDQLFSRNLFLFARFRPVAQSILSLARRANESPEVSKMN